MELRLMELMGVVGGRVSFTTVLGFSVKVLWVGEVVARRLWERPMLGESGSVGAARLVPRVSWWSGVGSGVGGRCAAGMVSLR